MTKKEKVRGPNDPPHADSHFKQQTLPSFFPLHTAFAVGVAMVVCAVIFIPIGSVVVSASDSIFLEDVRYDDVNLCTYKNNQNISTFVAGNDTSSQGCRTRKLFSVSKTIPAPIYIYYRLTKYHQNYRQYRKSRSDDQLSGDSVSVSDLTSDCNPFREPGSVQGIGNNLADGKAYSSYAYNPCGVVAWTTFNDTFNLYKVPSGTTTNSTAAIPSGSTTICMGGAFDSNGDSTTTHQCTKKGIALDVDVEHRYKAPATGSDQWTGVGEGTDPYRSKGWYAGEPGHKIPVTNDQDFMVWSRTAALPDFSKLYRIINTDLEPGEYLLDVEEYYDTASFKGEKHFVLATASWLGGKHTLLGGALLAVGCLSFVLAIASILVHVVKEARK